MNSFASALRRECRVAFSPRAQPLWFRLAKWTALLVLIAVFGRRPFFWRCLLVALAAGLAVHLFYRWKTRGWTRPWGGWDDLEAGRG